jgi:hypothetical protein
VYIFRGYNRKTYSAQFTLQGSRMNEASGPLELQAYGISKDVIDVNIRLRSLPSFQTMIAPLTYHCQQLCGLLSFFLPLLVSDLCIKDITID